MGIPDSLPPKQIEELPGMPPPLPPEPDSEPESEPDAKP